LIPGKMPREYMASVLSGKWETSPLTSSARIPSMVQDHFLKNIQRILPIGFSDGGNPYTPSASTPFTSGSILVNKFSIPAFKVTVLEGQPEQAPWSKTFTMPSLKL